MGLREIEKKNKIRELMRKKAAEYEMQRLEAQARIRKMTKEKLAEIARKHGVIIALDDDLKEEVERLKREYGIKESNIIRQVLHEYDVIDDKGKIDHEKLGMLAYQRVMLSKEETGGLYLLNDVFDLVNTGVLKGRVRLEDVKKAVKILKKKKIIPDIRELENNVIMISFFPVQYTQDQSHVLRYAQKNGGVCSLAEIMKEFGWSEERALRALQNLEKTGVARVTESYREGKRWFFPNLGGKK